MGLQGVLGEAFICLIFKALSQNRHVWVFIFGSLFLSFYRLIRPVQPQYSKPINNRKYNMIFFTLLSYLLDQICFFRSVGGVGVLADCQEYRRGTCSKLLAE